MFKPRSSPFIVEFAHTQYHLLVCVKITDRINGEGLGSEARASHGQEEICLFACKSVVHDLFNKHAIRGPQDKLGLRGKMAEGVWKCHGTGPMENATDLFR